MEAHSWVPASPAGGGGRRTPQRYLMPLNHALYNDGNSPFSVTCNLLQLTRIHLAPINKIWMEDRPGFLQRPPFTRPALHREAPRLLEGGGHLRQRDRESVHGRPRGDHQLRVQNNKAFLTATGEQTTLHPDPPLITLHIPATSPRCPVPPGTALPSSLLPPPSAASTRRNTRPRRQVGS